MTDLPPDVRDRAARGALDAVGRWRSGPDSEYYGAIVDAVAEVLADHWAPSAFAFLDSTDVEAERDALKARVAELEAVHDALAGGPEVGARRCYCTELRARVDLLTAALTDLVAYWDDESLSLAAVTDDTWAPEGERLGRKSKELRANARAVLSATPSGSEA